MAEHERYFFVRWLDCFEFLNYLGLAALQMAFLVEIKGQVAYLDKLIVGTSPPATYEQKIRGNIRPIQLNFLLRDVPLLFGSF